MRAGLIGMIDTPKQGNRRPAGVEWCADNDCYGQGWIGYDAWFGWLTRNAADAARCRFAVAPDVVADPVATLDRSLPWLPLIRELGYPVALAAQNGLTELDIPWGEFDVLFLGGVVECDQHGATLEPVKRRRGSAVQTFCPTCGVEIFEWKIRAEARELTAEAKRRGKWVHMGRVNSRKRFAYAEFIGCDSADGTTLAKFPDATLPDVLGWLASPTFQFDFSSAV